MSDETKFRAWLAEIDKEIEAAEIEYADGVAALEGAKAAREKAGEVVAEWRRFARLLIVGREDKPLPRPLADRLGQEPDTRSEDTALLLAKRRVDDAVWAMRGLSEAKRWLESLLPGERVFLLPFRDRPADRREEPVADFDPIVKRA